MKPSHAAEVVTKLLREFPNAATMTLAKRAYKEFPQLWSTLEACRNMFRYQRGASGKQHRKLRARVAPEIIRERQAPGDPFDKLPEPLETIEKWNPVCIPGPLRVGFINDTHIPYHDKTAVLTALRHIKDRDADTVFLNGDIADFFSLSFWDTDPRNRNFKAEIEAVVQFFDMLREGFPDARIIYRLGNHEERYVRYMRAKCAELLDIDCFQFESVYQLERNRIELVKDRNPVKLGALYTLHGHEHATIFSNPVNPARGLFLRSKVSAMAGHFHQTSQHSEPTLAGQIISTWGVGCLCDLHPAYRPLNNWNSGFAFIEVDKDGAFQVDNLRIVGGKAWH